jgi:hypothetical protein
MPIPYQEEIFGFQLSFADSEYLRAASGADALGRRPPVLHGYSPGILDFLLAAALHAIALHQMDPLRIYLER